MVDLGKKPMSARGREVDVQGGRNVGDEMGLTAQEMQECRIPVAVGETKEIGHSERRVGKGWAAECEKGTIPCWAAGQTGWQEEV